MQIKLIEWKAQSMYTYTTANLTKVHNRPTQPSKSITQHYKVPALSLEYNSKSITQHYKVPALTRIQFKQKCSKI